MMKLVDPSGTPLIPALDTALLRLIAKGHRWWSELRKGELDISALAAQEGVQPSYLTRVLRLAFLSPAVVDGMLKGRQSAGATVSDLTLGRGVPKRWAEQGQMLLVQ